MRDERFERLRDLFCDGLGLTPEQLDEFLRHACAGQSRLADEVRGMLADHAALEDDFEVAPPGGFLLGRPPLLAVNLLAEKDPPDLTTVVLMDRYRLDRKLADGGFSTAYDGTDVPVGGPVVVKIFKDRHLPGTRWWRHERLALRRLDVPGVVKLLDDGIHDGWPFLVTRKIDGTSFPGGSVPVRWDACVETVCLLLEILSRLHAAGVVHGDVKPDNVLVDGHGRPTLVDLGIAAGPAFGQAGLPAGLVFGFAPFVAPERLGDRPAAASVATDLYAVGGMIFHALTGQHPRDRDGTVKRVPEDAAPPKVRALLASLLDPHPARRPRSAAAALAVIEGDRPPLDFIRSMDWIGPRDVVDRLLVAAAQRRSLDICAPPGGGLTRTLREAAEQLGERGAEVRWVTAGQAPASSLQFAFRDATTRRAVIDGGFATPWEETALIDALDRGSVILVDPEEHLDDRSRRVLERHRGRGCVIRAVRSRRPGALSLPRLGEESLRGLFAGPDRIWHLPEDGARELLRRTSGLAGHVVAELAAWVRAGVVVVLRGQVQIERQVLDRLRHGTSLRVDTSSDECSGAERVRSPVGTGEDILRSALEEATDAYLSGAVGRSREVISTALVELRAVQGSGVDPLPLLRLLLRVSMAAGSAQALNLALYEMDRSGVTGDEFRLLVKLAEAALLVERNDSRRGLGLVRALGPSDDWELELRRHSIAVLAVRKGACENAEEVLGAAEGWAQTRTEDAVRRELLEWLGWRSYDDQEYADAARYHARAADVSSNVIALTAALLGAASAHLEACEFDRCIALATRGLQVARAARHPSHELRAEWLLRSASYRSRRTTAPDLELAAAAGQVHASGLVALVLLNEAAVAWRAGQLEVTRDLGLRAETAFRTAEIEMGAGLARALAIAAGQVAEPVELHGLTDAALAYPKPRVAVQTMALLAPAPEGGRGEVLAAAREMARAVPESLRDVWMHVLSVEESLARICEPPARI